MSEESKITYVDAEGEDGAVTKIEKLRKILKKCKKEKQEYLAGWQRARADHQNYIKQQERDTADFRRLASESLILQILPILDNLILARGSIPKSALAEEWVKGILQTLKYFESVLRENGVEMIAADRGDRFDTAYHEAAEEVVGEGESGTISEVLRKGYTLNGKVIRAARVKVIK
jgi:molecular chaperone GrpE